MSDRLFCVKPSCRAFGRHLPDCDGQDCRGCQRRPAADGLRLCQVDIQWMGENALAAADLYDELALRLVGGQGGGDKVSGTPGSRLPDQRAISARSDIYQTLTLIVGVIVAERGFAPPTRRTVQERPGGFIGPMPLVRVPDDRPAAYARLIATSVTWLAAHPQAGDFSDALSDLARGLPRSVAYPNGASRRELHKNCPMDGCAGKLMAVMRPHDAVLPPEVFCSAEEPHRWDATQWKQLDRLVARRAA